MARLTVNILQRNGANGNADKTIGWDINYFTFDFNFIHKANLYNNSTDGSDACFIRCVED